MSARQAMPFTPFHFGPGLALKSVTGRRFSFTVFCLIQVLIDLESGWYMLIGEDPLHRFFHTYLGATLAGVVAITAGKPACEWALRLWNSRLSPAQARWVGAPATIPWSAAVSGGLVGAWSHVALDSIMHADIRPFAPLEIRNALHSLIEIDSLYAACAVAGAIGLGLFLRGRR
jgi:hypothetical protein